MFKSNFKNRINFCVLIGFQKHMRRLEKIFLQPVCHLQLYLAIFHYLSVFSILHLTITTLLFLPVEQLLQKSSAHSASISAPNQWHTGKEVLTQSLNMRLASPINRNVTARCFVQFLCMTKRTLVQSMLKKARDRSCSHQSMKKTSNEL